MKRKRTESAKALTEELPEDRSFCLCRRDVDSRPVAGSSRARERRRQRGQSGVPEDQPAFMITPDQAWDWHVFKAECGPTYAGSAGWKRFADFLIAKMPELGAIDLDFVDVPYDHYIVDDWPDRRTHIHNSGVAVEKLVTDGTPVPVVAGYGMTSGSRRPRASPRRCSTTIPPTRRPRPTWRARFSSSRPRRTRIRRTPISSSTPTR